MQESKHTSCLEMKRTLLLVAEFYPFRIDPFSKGTDAQESKQEVAKVVSPPL